jgi:hypothetical protein
MRRLAGALVALGSVAFLGGAVRAYYGKGLFGWGPLHVPPETYWRVAVFFVLVAMALMMIDRGNRSA